MNLYIKSWKEFKLNKIFSMKRGTRLTVNDRENGQIPLITAGMFNEGVSAFISNKVQEKYSNCLTIDMFNNCFYHNETFCADDNVLILKNSKISDKCYLFIATIINQDRYRYNYGRQYRQKNYRHHCIKLPVKFNDDNTPCIDINKTYSEEGFVPDWQFMEDFIESLYHKLITTKIKSNKIKDLGEEKWEEFQVKDIFNIEYGINMELNTCTETTYDDPESIAFVARTSENNGVSAYVKKIDGKTPQSAETITIAGGGSVLSTFVQKRPFYSGRDLYLLFPKIDLNLKTKLFISTVLSANQYRYSYGRQANKTLPYLMLKLPIKRDENNNPIIDPLKKYSKNGFIPDWKFMEDYINSLPYSDRI